MLNEEELPNNIEGALGLLVLEGKEKLFAIDGQHRLAGIRQALQENSELGDEKVSAIFVAHRVDSNGLDRSRRLSSALNSRTKRVGR
jgi:DNA sulfur modification protein DndB